MLGVSREQRLSQWRDMQERERDRESGEQQRIVARANDEANESPVALFGMMLYRTPWMPTPIRKWGVGVWNRRYIAALPPRYRPTRSLGA